MNIDIKVIQHRDQRYKTPGDWFFQNGDLYIRISHMGNWRYECLVAFHELAEVLICKHTKINQSVVDKFDRQYEKERDRGVHIPEDEPGDDQRSPYRAAHFLATSLERLLSSALGVNWDEYSKSVLRLDMPK